MDFFGFGFIVIFYWNYTPIHWNYTLFIFTFYGTMILDTAIVIGLVL